MSDLLFDKIGAAYVRVSDERQDEYSPESQLKLVREFAKKEGFYIPDEFVFYDDGISAKSARKRTEFNKMIGFAKQKSPPFSKIYVWKFSRFARNQEESIVYKSMLKKNGVDVISISEPVAEGPFGTLIERIIEWMDEYYLIRLSDEVKRGMNEKFTRGEPVTAPPFGYTMGDNIYIVHPDESEIVRFVFEQYNGGMKMRSIARKLNQMGVKTKYDKSVDNRFVDYMLHNPVYIGKLRWSTNGRSVSKRDFDNENIILSDGKHLPIISVDLFESVQNKLQEEDRMYKKYQRKIPRKDFVFAGLVRCSNCGATLCNSAVNRMQCYNYTGGRCSVSHSVSTDRMMSLLILYLRNAAETLDFQFAAGDKILSNAPETDYKKLIAAEERKLERAKEAYRNGIDTMEEYAVAKKEISEKIKLYTKKISAAVIGADVVDIQKFADKVTGVADFLESDAPPSSKNEMMRTIIDHIVYNKSEKTIDVYLYL